MNINTSKTYFVIIKRSKNGSVTVEFHQHSCSHIDKAEAKTLGLRQHNPDIKSDGLNGPYDSIEDAQDVVLIYLYGTYGISYPECEECHIALFYYDGPVNEVPSSDL